MNRNANLWWGLILIGLGLMFLLDNMDVIDFGYAVRTYWPLILVIWGVSTLLSRSRSSVSSRDGAVAVAVPAGDAGSSSSAGEVRDVFNDRHENPAADFVSYSSVFGDLSLRPVSANFKGGTVSTVFGDTVVDLTAITLGEGDNVLKLSGVFGDVSVLLGPSMPYALTGHTLFGSIQAGGQKRDGFSSSLSLESPEFASAARKVRIDASQVFGDVIVTR